MKRIIVGISGASGVIYGIRLLEMLKEIKGVESHLVMTNGAKLNISLETDFDSKAVEELADVVHNDKNLGANIASGSYETEGSMLHENTFCCCEFVCCKSHRQGSRCRPERTEKSHHYSKRNATAFSSYRSSSESLFNGRSCGSTESRFLQRSKIN